MSCLQLLNAILFSFPWALAVILVNIKTVKVADDGILIEL